VRDALERLLAHDPAVRLELGPEGVHQARVATRRLRADLRTLRPLLDADVVEPLREELAWVGACLGEVRDLDVLAVEVRDAAARVAEPLDLPAILTLIDRHRADAQRALIEAMSSERYAALLRRLEGAAAVPPLQADISPLRPVKPLARRLLRKSWKRLQRLADGVDDASPAEAWHEIRKKAKGTRYAGELLEPFLGKDAARLADAAKQVQDELGRANDAINARRWLREHAITPASAYVAGRLDPVFDTGGGDVHRRWPQTWRPVVQAAKRI
jgi:CHAD domain-containing protein